MKTLLGILFSFILILASKDFQKSNIPSGTFQRVDLNGDQTGQLLIYPESDSTLLVYIDVTRGAPNFNSGRIYARATLMGGVYSIKLEDEFINCQLSLLIKPEIITIKTLNGQCGFGYGVAADGPFKLVNTKIPEYFINAEGAKVFFAKSPPNN